MKHIIDILFQSEAASAMVTKSRYAIVAYIPERDVFVYQYGELGEIPDAYGDFTYTQSEQRELLDMMLSDAPLVHWQSELAEQIIANGEPY